VRVGIGYDVHPFAEGRPLMLGGVHIEGEKGLSGHSDGDVLLHAVTDAILGACGLGDIGQHFPSDDPSYAGADSLELLRRISKLAQEYGYSVENVDAVVIAERPRLQPFIGRMRMRIASAVGLSEAQVSVKATTQDRLGAIGRGEGIAAMATALIK
jgi:2-C-methyl-D-erythritol 2,4-cyclodiphosphate synthase